MKLELIDIGANLTHASFDADRAFVLERAAAAGVIRQIVTGADLSSSRAAAAMAADAPDRLSATAGVHPHHASGLSHDQLDEFRMLLAQEPVVAVGECGLDYHRDFSPRPAQQAAFRAQLELAVEVQKPVFLHQRDAHADFTAILRDYLPRLAGGVAHCFTGGPRELEEYLAMGLSVGVTGWLCDERRGADLRLAVPLIPADRILVETDAPYLLPRDMKPAPPSRRNEPAYLVHIAAAAAALRGESLVALAGTSTANARRLFRL